MKYIAILGRQPELGLVELESLLGPESIHPWGRSAALIDQSIDLNRLGGAQKIGRILYQGPARDLNESPLSLDELPLRAGKTNFGLSYYGLNATQRFVVVAGMNLKKRLKSRGLVRFVAPQTGTHLSAAQVKFNGLVRDGFELIVAISKQQMVVAVTEQIQDIDWYAARDYQRPTRSAKVGMLPPKLAQMMVNTTSTDPVYDPFCGTGVILQEALLQGRPAIGSDVSTDMVKASNSNLDWLRNHRPDLPPAQVSQADAQTVTLPHKQLSIVSEGYLGPNLMRDPSPTQLKQLQRELGDLYRNSLSNWSHQLLAGSEVTLTSPMWRVAQEWQGLGLVDQIGELGYDVKQFAHAESRALIYRRPNQFVGRQLLILRKQ
jgi:tRNA G10  N-methylase Trm11